MAATLSSSFGDGMPPSEITTSSTPSSRRRRELRGERKLRPQERVGRSEQCTICFRIERPIRSEVLIQHEG